MREKGQVENDLLARLAADERLGGAEDSLASSLGPNLDGLLAEPLAFTGAATAQVAEIVRRSALIVDASPEAAAYTPGATL
jgi:adenylosuccinate lyase